MNKLKIDQSKTGHNTTPKKVVVVQRRLTHYRVSFFECLRKELSERGVQLILAHGTPTEIEKSKNDEGHISWATHLPTKYWLNGNLCWLDHSVLGLQYDLMVLTAENKMLSNLPRQYASRGKRVALWGHGANLQGNQSSLRERFKRIVAKRADWWLAYTDMSVPLIARAGYPHSRITVLNNSVDTAEMVAMRNKVTPAVLAQLEIELDICGDSVGIFVGSLYNDKRVGFMLEAAAAIKVRFPAFEFLVVGSGPQQSLVEKFCQQNKWAKYLGVRKGLAKVDALALAKVMINPGLVGLGILDSFVCGVPMLTTDCGLHSPEIVYLEHGVNGLMTPNTLEDYVDAVVALLDNKALLAKLKSGCEASSRIYTVENMARNFADGVVECLAAPVYR